VALSRNERWAVSSSEDKTLRIWDVDSGGLLATFTCDTSAPCCAFINDDKLVTGDAAGHVHFLRLVAPKPKG
jgi:WD40 repeat protein